MSGAGSIYRARSVPGKGLAGVDVASTAPPALNPEKQIGMPSDAKFETFGTTPGSRKLQLFTISAARVELPWVNRARTAARRRKVEVFMNVILSKIQALKSVRFTHCARIFALFIFRSKPSIPIFQERSVGT